MGILPGITPGPPQVRAWLDPAPGDRAVYQDEPQEVLWVRVGDNGRETALGMNFSERPATLAFPWPTGRWAKLIDSAAAVWGGPGSLTPTMLQAEPDFNLTLPAQSLILLARTPEEF